MGSSFNLLYPLSHQFPPLHLRRHTIEVAGEGAPQQSKERNCNNGEKESSKQPLEGSWKGLWGQSHSGDCRMKIYERCSYFKLLSSERLRRIE
ncbi:hypothetical protein TNCV_2542881 [Trichonephila clavipes]|nr:hypothetical protein TNCV_2542881 [Trichonephila clavipes]